MHISLALILSPITKGRVTSSTAPPKKLLTTSFAAKPTAIPVVPTLQAIKFFFHSFTPKRHDKSRLLRVENSTYSSSNAGGASHRFTECRHCISHWVLLCPKCLYRQSWFHDPTTHVGLQVNPPFCKVRKHDQSQINNEQSLWPHTWYTTKC